MTSTPERSTTIENTADLAIRKIFTAAENEVSEIQDLPAFVTYLNTNDLPYDDTNIDYWRGVATIAEFRINRGLTVNDPETNRAIMLAAHAPVAIHTQLHMDEHRQGRNVSNAAEAEYKKNLRYLISYNRLVKDFLQFNPEVHQNVLINLLAASADRADFKPGEAKKVMSELVKGARAERRLQSVAVTLGLEYKEGTVQDDERGIDCYIGGAAIDVKASVFAIQKHLPPDSKKAFAFDKGHYLYFPYDYDNDYIDGTFRLSPDATSNRLAQMDEDLSTMVQGLH